MSRTQGTEDFYFAKLSSIKSNYVQEESELNTREGVLLVFERIEGMTRTNTAKLYRAVLRWHCSAIGIQLDEGDMRLSGDPILGNKMKGYSSVDRNKVIEFVGNSEWPNETAKRFIKLHLFVGPLIGYRISELSNIECRADDQTYTFLIKNGKATNGRGNGKYRWVKVKKQFKGRDIKDALEELQNLYAITGVIESARQLHHKAVNHVFQRRWKRTKRPTLSSTRHEFKMSAQKSCGSRECSGAMVRISIAAKERQYGKKNNGAVKHDVELNEFHEQMEVNPENVNRVRDIKRPRGYERDNITPSIKN